MNKPVVLDPNDIRVREDVGRIMSYIKESMNLRNLFDSERNILLSSLALSLLSAKTAESLNPKSGVLDSDTFEGEQ